MEILKSIIPPILTKWEEAWLRANYPKLRYFPSHKLIYGWFDFDATYNGVRIVDHYLLSIDLTPKIWGQLPIVSEANGRIKKMSKLLNKPLLDLHTYESGEQCLIRPDKFFERYKYGVILPQFFEHLISHFYWLSYVYNYNQEPWEGEKHGWEPNEFLEWIQKQQYSSIR